MNFANYWQYTDIVTKALFFTLLGLSLATWIVGILRILQSRKLANHASQDLTQFIQQHNNQLTSLSNDSKKSITEQQLLQQINRYRFDSEKGLSVLGTTASIAPFIGLFGTVWGIFHALHRIGESGQAGLGQVAGPVGEALIMTGLGLAVAIPAVIMYNIAVRINRKALHYANDTAHSLLANVMLDTSHPVVFEANPSHASTKKVTEKTTAKTTETVAETMAKIEESNTISTTAMSLSTNS